jgi:hypothetical protein
MEVETKNKITSKYSYFKIIRKNIFMLFEFWIWIWMFMLIYNYQNNNILSLNSRK